MKFIISAFFILLQCAAIAQQEDLATLRERANAFIKQADYANAVLVLNRALQQDPDQQDVRKELAFAYYLQSDYERALSAIKPVLDRKDASIASFQVGAMIYKGREERGEAEKLYRKALKKYPSSGVLYSEYGELLWAKQDYTAIKEWEKGIAEDPNYPGNYYHATRYYYFTMDKAWSIIYGELFVNMESYSRRTVEIKNLLLNSYKKLFSDTDIFKNQPMNNEFIQAFLTTMNKQSSLVSLGITPASLIMVRTRFILDWNDKFASRFPHRLFDYHRQLLREGLFEAYNQWLFGSVQNLTAFQTWINTHADVYRDFTAFQQNRVFKMSGQLYQSK